MLDLGRSFLSSVERDPRATAIVDGDVRLSYENWMSRISALVDGLASLGMRRGDHVLVVMQVWILWYRHLLIMSGIRICSV